MNIMDMRHCPFRTARINCLRLGKIGHQIETMCATWITIEETLANVATLIARSRDFSLNPLYHLQEYFQCFTWEWIVPGNRQVCARMIRKADYAIVPLPASDWTKGFVLIKRDPQPGREIPKKPGCICFSPTRHLVYAAHCWPNKLLGKKDRILFGNRPRSFRTITRAQAEHEKQRFAARHRC